MDGKWTDAAIILAMVLLAIWVQSQFGQLAGRSSEAFIAGVYFAMGAVALIVLVATGRQFFNFIGVGNSKDLALFLGVGAVVGFLITSQGQLVLAKIVPSSTPGAIDPALSFVFVIILAPFVEEYFFRGALFPSISRFLSAGSPQIIATAGSALITSGLFSAWHIVASGGNLNVLQGEIIFSLAMIGLTVITNSIAPALGAHFVRNLMTAG